MPISIAPPTPTAAQQFQDELILQMHQAISHLNAVYINSMIAFWRGGGQAPLTGMTPQQMAAVAATNGVPIVEIAALTRDFLNTVSSMLDSPLDQSPLPTTLPGAIYTVAPVLGEDDKTVVTPGFDWEDVSQTITPNEDGSITITTPPMSTPPASDPKLPISFYG